MATFTHAYALAGGSLVSFNPTIPTAGTSVVVTGLVAGETLVGIDFRPEDGRLYGLGVNAAANTATLYTIALQTGVATNVASLSTFGPEPLPDLPASGYGFDFNSGADRIRVTTESGLNFRINPTTGQFLADGPTGGGIAAAAYTNNEPNILGVTTLYTLDSITDRLMIQNPPNTGAQIVVGPVGVDFDSVNGFDIPPGVDTLVANAGVSSGFGLALLTVGGTTQLYSINLVTGVGTLVGNFLNGAIPASGLAIQNTPRDDFNGDGKSDILWQNDNGQPGIWLMDGLAPIADSGSFFNPGPSWNAKGTGDFNGDGKADILWQNDDGTAGIWLMDGLNRLAGANVGFNPGPSWNVIDAGDFNGDGKADILWQNDNGTAGIWLMDGFTRLAGANVGFNPGPSWDVKASGDFNGDGKADILWQNDNGQAGIWLMDGLTVLADSGLANNPGPTWNVIDAGDFNGDGQADILWQNDNGIAAIWLMNGFTQLAGAGVGFNPGPTWQVKAAADYNGDNRSDILWQNDNGQPGVWLMSGLTVLADSGVGFNPGPSWHVVGQNHEL